MAAETRTIMANDLARVRQKDFALQFTGSLQKMMEALGVTRKEQVTEGSELKVLKVTGTLQSGAVAEGELIPLSQYQTTYETVGTVTLNKWRKATTAEAVIKKGADQAVGETTDKMLKDIQKGIRNSFFSYLENGTSTASGTGLQAALANGWGKLQVLFEDDAVDTVYFVNPMDVADYLGKAQVTMQTAFGMNYIENFLGLGTVFLSSQVTAGTYFATAKENIILYYLNVANSEAASAFNLTTDETGYVGINEFPDNTTARIENLVMSMVTFFAERIDGVLIGTINSANPQ